MTSIAEYFLYTSFRGKKDSIIYYTTLAFQESKKINYTHGIAESYADKAFLANALYSNYSQAEQLAYESLKWFNGTSDKSKIALTYWQLSEAQCMQSKYNEGLINAKLCYKWAKKTADTGSNDRLINALETLTDIYRERGEYDKLLAAQQELIDHEKATGDDGEYSLHELWVMGLMYMLLEDYQTALFYWRKLFSGKDNSFLSPWNRSEYAQLLTLANEPDSALYYYNLFDSAKANISDLRYFIVSKGEYFLYLKQYKTALPYFFKSLIYNRELNDQTQVKRTILDIAKTYAALNKNDSAISYARQCLSMALQIKSKPSIRDGYEILYTTYNHLHQSDSAFYYYQHYVTSKEAVMDEQTKGKIATHGYQHKIDLMSKEQVIADQHVKIQQQQLKQNSLQEKILIGSIAGILLIGGFIFSAIMLKRKNEKTRLENELQIQKLESKKKEAELKHQASELELQALRAQMNPHFIFNCLNSINWFIINNDAAKAADYLTKFAKLIRIVLEQSGKSFVPLEDELKCLQLYMDLEALRFEIPFQYNINCNGTDTSTIMIPTLLIQPFVENAIWHGLPGNCNNGKINIDMHIQDNILHCKICDNGVGRIAALKEKTALEKKSLGINLTQHRLQLIDLERHKSGIEIHDLIDEEGQSSGTCVHIKIPVKEM